MNIISHDFQKEILKQTFSVNLKLISARIAVAQFSVILSDRVKQSDVEGSSQFPFCCAAFRCQDPSALGWALVQDDWTVKDCNPGVRRLPFLTAERFIKLRAVANICNSPMMKKGHNFRD